MNYVERDSYGMYNGSQPSGPGPRLMGANTLLDNDVYNPQGEKIGDIKEFMLDMQSGQVAYAVLSFGGFLGMGEKLFAVPWKALSLDTKNHRFTMNVSRERLDKAPGFDKNRWPDMSDPRWSSSIHEYYGTSPSSASGSTASAASGTTKPSPGASTGKGY
jgi:sporulation protein YlmC with PRC-barrel domain